MGLSIIASLIGLSYRASSMALDGRMRNASIARGEPATCVALGSETPRYADSGRRPRDRSALRGRGPRARGVRATRGV